MVSFIKKIFNKEKQKDLDKVNIVPKKKYTLEIKKIFHSCFLISYSDKINVLIDPYFNNCCLGNLCLNEKNDFKKEDLPKIDIVLISHEHFDHFDKDAIEFLIKRDSPMIVAPMDVTKQLKIDKTKERTIKVDDEIIVSTIKIKVLPAQHPQSYYPVGYIIEKNDKKIYFAGDTNALPNIRENIDIAILPAGGIFTADIFEFVSMARQLKCNIVIPMHYNTFDLIKIDCNKLKFRCEEKLKECKLELLDNLQSIKI